MVSGPWECESRVYLKLAIATGAICLVTIAVGWLEMFWILAGVDSMFPMVTCMCDCGVCLDWCGS